MTDRLDDIEATIELGCYRSEGYDYKDPHDDLRYLLRVARLTDTIAGYATHAENCKGFASIVPCSCGLDDALAALEAVK